MSRFSKLISELGRHYGKVEPPPARGVLELVLWENIAYLADDQRRAAAFARLKKEVGFAPDKILAAPAAKLKDIASAGIVPDSTVKKLRKIAQIARDEFDGDAESILALPPEKARRALKKFPMIGGPGADKLLLLTRTHPVLALESNGLRVLVRVGYAKEGKDYAATYRAVQEAVRAELAPDCDALIQAHVLLRRHGQELCRRSKPRCGECPVRRECAYFAAQS
ncbi:MAG: hypothetical protein LAN37_15395 [Acidobacteriia bacterium]|nr:hypothetical protein [Terriglobia bacterium]